MPEKRYSRLTLAQREMAEEGLNMGRALSRIAADIGASTSTVCREIRRNRRDDGRRGARPTRWSNGNVCAKRRGCETTGLCAECADKGGGVCSKCSLGRCMGRCGEFEEESCWRLSRAPHCCNGCRSLSGCRLSRFRHGARDADAMARSRARESREGPGLSEGEMEAAAELIKGLLAKGQGVAHIFMSHAGEMPFSERSFYRHARNEAIAARPVGLPKKVKHGPRKEGGKAKDTLSEEALRGRRHEDFLALSEDERAGVVEADCVEGTKDCAGAILTPRFKAIRFQIGVKLEAKNSACVKEALGWLRSLAEGEGKARPWTMLCDRGSEFADAAGMEAAAGPGARAFCCDARRPDQKGACEKNHVELRKAIPKGTPVDWLGPCELAEVFSHVNSGLRGSLCGKAPLEMAYAVLPRGLMDGLGYRLVPPEEVVLSPSLLDALRAGKGKKGQGATTPPAEKAR
jgi:IS30 family transposase